MSAATLVPCIVVPCYNHGATMAQVLDRLLPFGLPCFVVDDGSGLATQLELQRLSEITPGMTLLRLDQNKGKGGAVLHGLRMAQEAGFTHAIQLDADGQHAIEDIPKMLALATQHPDGLISGCPVYDDTVPRARHYGRWLTHIWVWIETLSFSLKDSMCGFRIYPIANTVELADQVVLGQRMDFDIEVMVRLYWLGIFSYFLPTRVVYPDNGVSHFDAFKDNLRICWMHTRLFFGMLPRIPHLLFRSRHTHWARRREVKGLVGMRVMLMIWTLLGRRVVGWLMYPVIAVYWLLACDARRASVQWLARVRMQRRALAMPDIPQLSSYRHFLRFGDAMLDKVAGWRGQIRLGEHVVFAPGAEAVLHQEDSVGKLILASHLGDIEVCRALVQRSGYRTVNALVFHENARRFRQIMDEIAPHSGVNLIPVTDFGPDTAMLLKNKLDAGEWVAIVGDRTSLTSSRDGRPRVIWSRFMGYPAPFPQGPFVLAAALRCPVFLAFSLHQEGKLRFYCEPFAHPLVLPRNERQAALQHAVDRYAARLEHHALQAPLDWFNFFDFWKLPDNQVIDEMKR